MDSVTHLYIHLPFCARRCGYCDFYSETGATALAGPYVGAVLDELDGFAEDIGRLETVYLGGGTPTLIGAGLLDELLDGVLSHAVRNAEVTIEANPSTVTASLAQRLKRAGVTRVSLGAQSFDPQMRKNLGRGGAARAVQQAVTMLRGAGFRNIALDMIFGIPGQAIGGLRNDIESVLSLEPEHISYYELTAKEGSVFRERWESELEAMENNGRLYYETVVDSLEAAGYRWYETSNFAMPGKECRHNLAYWDGADYIGLGAGAWSTVGRRRWHNPEGVKKYTASHKALVRKYEILSREDKAHEKFILGLRCHEGVNRRESDSVIDQDQIQMLTESGFVQESDGLISLTREGRFLGNEISARLLN